MLKADSGEYDKALGINARRLLGDVVFRHEDIYMFCDSAYIYHDVNMVKAFNNVRIKQGDTILLVSNYLEYDGNLKLAKMRDSVILMHHNSMLLTDSLDYDRNNDIAYYFGGGRIFDGENKLSSKRGYYYTRDKDYYAVDTVLLKNPQYIIDTDTMQYNTESSIAYFYSGTHITSDENLIYCEYGQYDTENDKAILTKKPWLRSGSNYLVGDSLFYDRKIRFGEGFRNVSVIDTVENVVAKGDYGYFFEDPQNAMLTINTQVIFVNEGDSLFMHSDTVRITVDTTNNKLIRAFRKVQVYKSDMQARCDSLTFYSLDSIAHMYYQPVLWAEGNKQARADHISVYFENKEPKNFYMDGNAFVIENIDTIHYSQAKSRKIEGLIENSELKQVDLYSDCETVYYLVDEDDGEIMALNKLLNTDMTIFFKDNKINNLWFYGVPDGNFIPIEKVVIDETFLKDFLWLDKYRPKKKEDIFKWVEIDEFNK
jgi:lipopolysaccharide export system protein LptA